MKKRCQNCDTMNYGLEHGYIYECDECGADIELRSYPRRSASNAFAEMEFPGEGLADRAGRLVDRLFGYRR